MSRPRISFSWKPTISGREHWRWGLWLVVPSKSGRRSKLRIMVRGLLLWLSGLAILAYLGAATAWYAVLEQRPNNLVTWKDCALAPVRWSEIRRKQGDANIAAGIAALDARNWSEAVVRLQAGLVRSPDNRAGREKLALFWVAAGQRARGLALFKEGVERAYPGRSSIETVIRIAVSGEEFDLALEVVDLALAQSGGAVDRDREWLCDQKCRLLLMAERYEAAVAWIEKQPSRNELLFESLAVAQIELHRYDEARKTLDAWQQGSGGLGGSQRLRVRLDREAGDLNAMRTELQAMRDRQPSDPSPWVYAVVQEALAGQADAARALLDQYLLRFGARAPALVLAGQPLVEIQRWALFDEVDKQARDLGLESPALHRLRFTAKMGRGAYAAALEELGAISAQKPAGPEAAGLQVWIALNQYLAEFLANGEKAPAEALLDLLRKQPLALGALNEISAQLETGQQPATALAVLEIAHARFPGSANVSRKLDALRITLADQVPATDSVEIPLVQDGQALDIDAAMATEVGESSALERELGSPKLFFALCDRLIGEQDWGQLGNALRELRRQRPSWIAAHEGEVLDREIELNLAEKNGPALVSNVRFRLDGTLPRALEIMNVVRRLDTAGQRESAERVLTEIERRYTDFPPARRQRKDWAEADAAKAATSNDTTLKP